MGLWLDVEIDGNLIPVHLNTRLKASDPELSKIAVFLAKASYKSALEMEERQNKRLSPIDRRLKEMGKSRIWLIKEMRYCIKWATLDSWCKRGVPSFRDANVRRMIQILGIDENYLAGIPAKA
jgi:hypothetical protein